ncbi:MAG TPA: sensor histidine kinase [Actinomycetota bacterium]|nr:sensor histidine kinase [Actinomycetota bacterium]
MEGGHRALARGSFALSAVLSVVSIVFLALAADVPSLATEFGPKGFAVAFAISLGGVGAIVASRRPENPIGWIFCALGVLGGVMGLGAEYARWALLVEGGRPPGGRYAAWVQEWLWIPLVGGLAVIASLFPDGRFRSTGWRRSTLIATALVAVPTLMTAIVPELTVYEGFDNPMGMDVPWLRDVSEITISLLLPIMFLGTASALTRFRRARGDERQQLKWLVLSMSVVVAMTCLYAIVAISLHSGANPQDLEWAEWGMIVGFTSVPVSIAFGVLKYRLYDIDIVINRAVVYGALAVFITIVYVAIVVGVGATVGSRGSAVLSAVAAATVALVFQPARRWAQRFANRVVYGERATPYEVLAELGERLAGEYAADDVLHRVAATLAGGIGAERVVVWLQVDTRLRSAAVWPAGGERPGPIPVPGGSFPEALGGMRAFAVRHQGEMLGAIGIRKPASEPITEADERLVSDLAGQAGLVLRNVRLIEDLRASRRRLVAAQDEERRRLERDIHDGSQQQLVALTVKARLAEQLIERDPAKARELVRQIQTETTEALETLRDLARGIYPPLLADKGLVAAIQAQGRKAGLPIHVEADGVDRFSPDVEAGVYFCVLEALNNTAKYADASRVDVRLSNPDGHLAFEVRDDGAGFDASATTTGTGLQGMADRLAAIGGAVEIHAEPGAGTTVVGRVPATGNA